MTIIRTTLKAALWHAIGLLGDKATKELVEQATGWRVVSRL